MRRLVAILVALAACGTMFSLGALLARPAGTPAGAEEQGPLAWMLLAHPAALAQETMQFRSVPPESVTSLDRRRAPKPATPPSTTIPEPPSAPAPPPVPDLPTDQSGDVVRFGSDIVVREGQVVSGDVVAMGGDVTVNGHVEKDVVAMGGDVFLGPGGIVDGQVVTLGGKLHEQPGSHVGGQRVTAEGLPRHWGPFFGVRGMVSSGIKVIWSIAKMMLMLLIAWGITQLAPQRTRTAVDAFKSEPVKSLGFGLLAAALFIPSIVALALVVAILCITIIGIPLALAVILGYVLAILLLCLWGYVVGAAVLGERLARQMGRSAPSLTLMAVWGIVALTVVRVVGHLFGGIPMGGFAGGALVFLAVVTGWLLTTIGAGALLWTQLRRDALSQWWPGPRGGAGREAAPVPGPAVVPGAQGPPMSTAAPMPATEPPSPPLPSA
jgi:hypothetical protein